MNREQRRRIEAIQTKALKNGGPEVAAQWQRTQLEMAFKDLEARFPGCGLVLLITDQNDNAKLHYASNLAGDGPLKVAQAFVAKQTKPPEPANGG